MPSPRLSAIESEQPLTVTSGGKRIFQSIYRQQNQTTPGDEVQKIKVSELISKMAFYYEKIRNSVDYKEEYILRKEAIARILKRKIVLQGSITGNREEDPEKIAHQLLIELIQAGYLGNNELPETKIEEVANILDRYIKLKEHGLKYIAKDNFFSRKGTEVEGKTEATNWIIGMAASEIEENLNKNQATDMIVGHMYEVLNQNIDLPADLPYEKDLSIQILLSIYRNFLNLNDKDVLSYVLLKYYYNDWLISNDPEIIKIAENINDLKFAINEQINHPLWPQLDKVVHKYTVYFMILRDVISEDPQKVYQDLRDDPKAFPRQIKKACAKRYKEVKSKLWRSAVRSIIYIFLTKSILVFALEVPLIKFLEQDINTFSLVVNICFPAFILFLSVAMTKLPSDNNTGKIVGGIEEIMFEEQKRTKPIMLKRPAKRGKVANTIFTIIYTITFFISFGLIIGALDIIGFNWVSIIIFLFFLAFASFFAIRIRRSAKYLFVVEVKENIIAWLAQFFYIPIISTGKWLSTRFSKINVFVFILDFIIEAPFKIFVEVTEDWSKYLRERRDKLS
ncbi:MAG: hypothetical protein V1865_00450 [bacterium]